jgi:hypothetical protein
MFALGGLTLILNTNISVSMSRHRNTDLILRLNTRCCLDGQSVELQLFETPIVILLYKLDNIFHKDIQMHNYI